MKKIILFITAGLTLLTCILLFVNFQKKKCNKWVPPKTPFLQNSSDWMALQRAYPNKGINQNFYMQAMRSASNMHRQKADLRFSWVFAGPLNIGGRITDIEALSSNSSTIYVGTATGGIFKTINIGQTWTNIFSDQPFISIGDIAIDQTNSNIIYAGTGEANHSSFSFLGGGIYKSTNAGASWIYSGLLQTAYIGRIVIDNSNPNRLYAAACGSLFTHDSNRGIYRSNDGGINWEKKLFLTDSTAAIDIIQHPTNPNILLAAMWERTRGLNYRNSYGPSSGIYKTTNGGDTWQNTTDGFFPYNMGRTGLAISPTNPNIVYALCDNEGYIDVLRSTDGGSTWEQKNTSSFPNLFSYFGWYFGQIRVDPSDENRIYVMGVEMWRSDDGGDNWTVLSDYNNYYEIHVDHHAMYINPNTGNILEGNDGGLYSSDDLGDTWNKINNLPVTQFYELTMDYQNPDKIYGGTQDNNTICTQTGADNDWFPILGGDGFYSIVDYTDSNIIYAEWQYGMLNKSYDGGMSMQPIYDIWQGDRTNWSSPVVMDPQDPNTLYFGTFRVWKTNDGGLTWNAISNDLTKGDDGTAWHTLSTLSISSVNPVIIISGSDDGKVFKSIDEGLIWTDISSGLPDRYVTRVICDPVNANVIYVTLSGFRWSEPYPHIFKSSDLGQNWINISGNLPDLPVDAFAIDPINTMHLFAGTDAGVFASFNGGQNWFSISANIGNVPVTTMQIHEPSRTLLIGTYGLSAYKVNLDQITSVLNNDFSENISEAIIFPNPYFLNSTQNMTIQIQINELLKANISIVNANGEEFSKITDKQLFAGLNKITINAKEIKLNRGVYFCIIKTKGKIITKKFLVLS